MPMCGGTTEVKDADENVQQICDKVSTSLLNALIPHKFRRSLGTPLTLLPFQVKSKVEQKAGKTYDVFTAKKYKTQLVAGTNYFIKVLLYCNYYIQQTSRNTEHIKFNGVFKTQRMKENWLWGPTIILTHSLVIHYVSQFVY